MNPNVTLYFMRHGETDWNAERRYQGQTDIPLNDNGRAQARRNGQALRAFLPALSSAQFISSPLGRARETMDIVCAELGLPPGGYAIEPRIIELSYGAWEGQLQDDLPKTDAVGVAERAKDPFHWRPTGGESYADLLKRTAEWLNTIDRDAVITSHGGVSRCLRGHILGLDEPSIPDLESPQDRILVLTSKTMEWV